MQNSLKPENFKDPGRRHLIRLPRTILVGKSILDEAPKILTKMNASRILIIAGPKTWKIAGKELSNFLSSQNFHYNKYIAEEATKSEANEAIEQNKGAGIGAVFGVGGGKNIDIAKVVAKNLSAPMISIPTALSHDGVASPFASLKRREQKFSQYTTSPLAVLVDLRKIACAPRSLIRSGVADIISNMNAILDWKLAREKKGEYFGAYAGSLSEMSAKLVLDSKKGLKNMDLEAIRTLSEAIISSGIAMGIAGSSRPASGAEHLFSHALDSINEDLALHGEQCGVGTILMLYHRGNEKWKEVRDFLRAVNAPTTAGELGVPPQILLNALVKAPKIRDRFTILDQMPLSEKEAKQLLKETGVIS